MPACFPHISAGLSDYPQIFRTNQENRTNNLMPPTQYIYINGVNIIVYTNYGKFGDIKKLVNLGINGYVNKGPKADLSELINMVKSKLEPMDEESMKKLVSSTEIIGRE